jgi:hypothetical protein
MSGLGGRKSSNLSFSSLPSFFSLNVKSRFSRNYPVFPCIGLRESSSLPLQKRKPWLFLCKGSAIKEREGNRKEDGGGSCVNAANRG